MVRRIPRNEGNFRATPLSPEQLATYAAEQRDRDRRARVARMSNQLLPRYTAFPHLPEPSGSIDDSLPPLDKSAVDLVNEIFTVAGQENGVEGSQNG